MAEVLGEEDHRTDSLIPSTTRPAARHLGPYPLVLPRPSDPRMHLAVVTTTLQVLGQTVFDFEVSIAQILISIATCAVIELAVTFRRQKAIVWPASAMLTGNGIALILRVPGTEHGDWWSLNGWWVFVGCSMLAMASKYLIRVKGRHIFNPSNFALVATFIALGENRADPQVLWWGPLSPGLVIAFAVILAGSVVITRRVHQGHSAAAFWVAFATAVGVIAASGHAITARWHVGPIEGWDYWWLLVTSPEVLVFLFFMITDPKTAPKHRSAQLVYGASIALLGALIISTQSGEFGTKVGILAALVLLCPFVRRMDRAFDQPRLLTSERPRRLLIGAGLAVILPVVLFASGRNFSAETSVDAPLERRDEVDIDELELPGVDIAPDAIASSVALDDEMAGRMAAATVEDLLLESLALQTSDTELAAAGLTGTRLDQATTRIDTAGPSHLPRTDYAINSLTATVIRTSSSPQAPPRLAVRVTGETTTAGVTEPLDSTFTLTPIGDTFLVDDAFDSDGRPIGARPGEEPPIEAAIDPDGPSASVEELDGLRFEDVTAQVGLDIEHSDRVLREGPAAATGGVAVGDYDGDGDDDLFLTRVGLPNALMRNDDGHFADVTEEAGLEMIPGDTGSTGAMFVDVTGDSVLDLVVLGLGRTPNRLHIGTGSGTFDMATGGWQLPVTGPPSADGSMFSLAAADYDRDGRIDLLLGAADPTARLGGLDLSEDSPQRAGSCDGFPPIGTTRSMTTPGRTVLLRNTGAGFENVSDRLDVDTANLVVMNPRFADLNDDGFPDLLVAGHLCTTRVLMNDTMGGFVDTSEEAGVSGIHTANGASVTDLDADGDLDLFLTGISYLTESGECPLDDPQRTCGGNHLLLGNGDGTFRDATEEFGVGDGFWGWGSVAEDLNSNGRTDLSMTNGFEGVATARSDDGRNPERPYFERGVDDPERLWLNTPDLPWPQGAEDAGLTGDGNGKAMVRLDYDSDGRPDLLVANTDGSPTLWRNVTENSNDWVSVRLEDPRSPNRSAIGAVVIATWSDGSTQKRSITTDGSFQSGQSAVVYFGARDGSTITSLDVRWPDGASGSFSGPSEEHSLVLTRT